MNSSHIPKVSGSLINFLPEQHSDLVIRYTLSTPTYRRQVAKTAKITSEGKFHIELDQAYPYRELWIAIGDFYFGKVIVNEGLSMEFDMEKLTTAPIRFLGEGVTFGGEDAEGCRFINSYEIYKLERKEELQEEKLRVVFDSNFSKSEKVDRLKKIYHKLSKIEQSFAKKQGRHLQWLITNDRIASMYADILSIHWGKSMDPLLFRECVDFKPLITSNATVQYYDFLGYFLSIPNRLELKLITENTLREQVVSKDDRSGLDIFLREFSKKTDRLRFDQVIYEKGEDDFLFFYETELLGARMDLHFRKFAKLSRKKADLVTLISQPQDASERQMFLDRAEASGLSKWALDLGREDLASDKAKVESISKALQLGKDTSGIIGLPTSLENAFTNESGDLLSLLNKLSSHFAKKAIILDVWVPWIDRCKKDVVDNTHLYEVLATLPIEMVYLCSSDDTSQEQWLRELSLFPRDGTHIFLSDSQSYEIMDYFGIRNYPSYLYVDTKRNLHPHLLKNLSHMDLRKVERQFAVNGDL